MLKLLAYGNGAYYTPQNNCLMLHGKGIVLQMVVLCNIFLNNINNFNCIFVSMDGAELLSKVAIPSEVAIPDEQRYCAIVKPRSGHSSGGGHPIINAAALPLLIRRKRLFLP